MPQGYGRWRHRGQEEYAHRQAWVLTNGPIPAGYVIRHTCDNPPCVNPTHLHPGKPIDNVRDREERGRSAPIARFTGRSHAKLTEDQAGEIKRRLVGGARKSDLAREFGVSESAIYQIRNGTNWASVTP